MEKNLSLVTIVTRDLAGKINWIVINEVGPVMRLVPLIAINNITVIKYMIKIIALALFVTVSIYCFFCCIST